jgi:CHRD domain
MRLIGLLVALAAQTAAPTEMRARLAPVPIDVAMQGTIAGLGVATATVAGLSLSVEGTYRGLRSAATSVRIYESAKPGLRGRLVGEFAAGGGTTGTFKGTVTLTRDQATAFSKGLLYVQLQTTGTPDGALWGWLLAPKGPRP